MSRLLDSKLDELDAEISAIEQKKRGYLYDCRLYDEDNILCGSSQLDFWKAAVQEFMGEEELLFPNYTDHQESLLTRN